jgi:glycosyltransferase involved in cell wall biosynthesis
MRLAYFTNRYGMASYTFIMTEVEHLRRLGHTVLTFSVRHPGSAEAVNDDVAREQSQTEYFLDNGQLHWRIPKIALATLKALATRPRRTASAFLLSQRTSAPGLKARLKQVGYLVMGCYLADRMRANGVEHLHNHLGSSSASIAMLASAVGDIPYSLTIHGGQIFTEPRQWALADKIERSEFTACISSFCLSQCMLFSPSHAWDRLKIVRCSVDERFLDGDKTAVPDAPRLVSVGRLAEEKGQLVLIDAVARLVARGVEVSLTLVGDGPMRPLLEERIARLGLGPHVHLTGLLGTDDVRRALSSARGFVLASFTEGLPVSIMEALAQRRPVVATNVGAVAELVRPEETGWLVSPGSVDELAEAMGKLLSTQTSTLTEMGSRGAALVADRHRASTEIRTLERLLLEAIERRRSSDSRP